MNKFSTWLLVLFIIMFWVFRIVVTFTYTMGIEFGIEPLNVNIEVILLFITLLSIILIVKRKILGAILYLVTYGLYFGVDLYNTVMAIIGGTSDLVAYTNTLISFIAMVLPIITLFDLLLDKNKTAHPKDKKTDWFYKNEQYDRKLDERADKNNYRTL